jgi:hypothetical protein
MVQRGVTRAASGIQLAAGWHVLCLAPRIKMM